MKPLRILLLAIILASCSGMDRPDKDKAALAHALYDRADSLLRKGDMAQGHALMQEVHDIYASLPGYQRQQSLCLYQMAVEYMNLRDTTGLQDILGRMKALKDANPLNSSIAYDYYSVLSTDYTARFEEDPSNPGLRDTMLLYMKAGASEMERIPREKWKEYLIEPAWAYYNIAVSYDLYFDPTVRDSVSKYLEKAELARSYPGQDERGWMETFISTEDLRAWLKYYDGDYDGAKASMDSVLAVIEKVEEMSPNTVITERGEAYSFFVEMYSSLGQFEEALKYQQLLEENNRRRYNVERLSELHDVSERYQNEKKQAEIQRLRTLSLWRLWLIAGLSILAGALALVFILYRRNAQQKLYEMALEAENRMAEEDSARSSAKLILEKLRSDIASLPASNPSRKAALEALSRPDLPERAESVFSSAQKPLSSMDRKYLYCILAGLSVEQIAVLFNIQPESVYTVRYRLRRKFASSDLPI